MLRKSSRVRYGEARMSKKWIVACRCFGFQPRQGESEIGIWNLIHLPNLEGSLVGGVERCRLFGDLHVFFRFHPQTSGHIFLQT